MYKRSSVGGLFFVAGVLWGCVIIEMRALCIFYKVIIHILPKGYIVHKKIEILTLLITATLFLVGCPYSSMVPLAKATEPIPKALLGTWEKVEDSYYPDRLDVEVETGNWCTIQKYSYDADMAKYTIESSYTTHFTTIDGVLFANMKNDGTYYLYRINIASDGSSFKLLEVTDNIQETFDTSDELYAFVKKYKDLSFFYNNSSTDEYRRVTP